MQIHKDQPDIWWLLMIRHQSRRSSRLLSGLGHGDRYSALRVKSEEEEEAIELPLFCEVAKKEMQAADGELPGLWLLFFGAKLGARCLFPESRVFSQTQNWKFSSWESFRDIGVVPDWNIYEWFFEFNFWKRRESVLFVDLYFVVEMSVLRPTSNWEFGVVSFSVLNSRPFFVLWKLKIEDWIMTQLARSSHWPSSRAQSPSTCVCVGGDVRVGKWGSRHDNWW